MTLTLEKPYKPLTYGTGSVASADGTTIGYIYLGNGPQEGAPELVAAEIKKYFQEG